MNIKRSILVIDIGNTSTSLGIYKGGRIGNVNRIEKIKQSPVSVMTEIRKTIGNKLPDGVCIASVVPPLNPLWDKVIQGLFKMKPLWVSCYAKLGIGITYPNPESIGADRLANAVGGVRKYGAPVVIADFGTAVTFDVVSKGGGYIGGIIAPGLPLMFDYLAERTAQLPQLSWKPVRGRVGKSTTNAMQLGAHWGYRGMVREILQELKREPKLKSAVVCATGGYAAKVLSGIKPKLIIEPTLTLFGIGCIYELNR